jgi:RNA polymerase sigma-70 factor (ECF subfamily)
MEGSEITREEFTALVRQTEGALRPFVRMLGVNADFVDDIAQETYVVAYKNFKKYDPSRNLLKWLRGIARNIVIQERRKSARHRRIMDEGLSHVMLSYTESDDPSDPAETGEMISALGECLSRLSERNREIIRERYYAGRKTPEISRHLRMKVNAVRQALLRIREFLRKCVAGKTGEVTA